MDLGEDEAERFRYKEYFDDREGRFTLACDIQTYGIDNRDPLNSNQIEVVRGVIWKMIEPIGQELFTILESEEGIVEEEVEERRESNAGRTQRMVDAL